jgi:hypothetical protein
MNSHTPTAPHGSFDVYQQHPNSPPAAASVITTPQALRVFVCGELVNRDDNSPAITDASRGVILRDYPNSPPTAASIITIPQVPPAITDAARGVMLHNRSPHSASRHFINLSRLPYLINVDQFINAPPPRSPYAHGTRDVVCGGSGGDLSSPYADGSSDIDSSLPPINVFRIYDRL